METRKRADYRGRSGRERCGEDNDRVVCQRTAQAEGREDTL